MKRRQLLFEVGAITTFISGIAIAIGLWELWTASQLGEEEDVTAIVALFLGMVGMVIGLTILLSTGVFSNTFNSPIGELNPSAQTINHAWNRSEPIALVFAFYGLLGLIWGNAFDSSHRWAASDLLGLLLLSLPHSAIYLVAMVQGKRRGTFLGLTPIQFSIWAAIGIASPIAFFLLTR